MPKRQSQYAQQKSKRGGAAFLPDLAQWTQACKICAYVNQIYKYFGISAETFYAFMDKERIKIENGENSEYIESYNRERKNTKDMVAKAFFDKIKEGDTSSVIFGMKSYNGAIEQKDLYLIEMKKKELELKTKQFLTELGNKFNLNYEQLNEFASKYFKDSKLDDI